MPHKLRTLLITFLLAACTASPATFAPTPTAPSSIPAPTAPAPTATSTPPLTAKVWLTTADQSILLAPQPDIQFGPVETADHTVYINENHHYQQMDGFGAALTDSSAWLIAQMPEAERSQLLTELFSPTEGIGISALRLPMGASDFTHGPHYSYDDLPAGSTDPDLVHFSIAHDESYIIPLLQQILEINPDIFIMASPWSVPGWMKTTGSLIGGSLLPEYYDAYSQYFVKFIQAYDAHGITIHAITLQNEPHHEPGNYPGMRLEPEDAAIIVKNHLGPAFNAAGLSTKIIVWDHNWDEWDYPITVLDDPDAKAYIDGAAFHCYKGTLLTQIFAHDAHPDSNLYFTECTGGAWIRSFAQGLKDDMKNLAVGSVRSYAKTVMKWNLVLDTQSGPHNGGCGNCAGLVTLDTTSNTIASRNFDYYSIGHASKFVLPGAYRIASSSFQYSGLETVAFQNPDGSKALILSNTSSGSKTIAVRWGSQSFSYTLPGGAVATLTWQGTQDEPAAPSTPGETVIRTSSNRLSLVWDFSPLAQTYTLERAVQPGGPYTTLATNLTLPEYIDTDVTNGTTYYYTLLATNTHGTSALSPETSAVPAAP